MSKLVALVSTLALSLACASTPASDDPAPTAKPSAAAPSPATSPSRATLDGAWQLRSLAALPGALAAPVGLTIDGATFKGSNGCNTVAGTLAGQGTAVRFTIGEVTELDCDDPRNTLESAYGAMMARVAGHRSDAGELVLLDASGAELARFAPAAPTPAAPTPAAPTPTPAAPTSASSDGVANTAWRVTGYADGTGVVASTHTARMTFKFADGKLTGHGVCNNFGGTYRQGGAAAVALSIDGVTELACGNAPDGIEAEGAYVRALGKVARYRRSGATLELLAADGSVLVRATLAP
ncbi:MAG: META domain-containing protein [Kofleriaceae bacterium]|nr:META domain-containing protein [Kofleriaceae bacterium]